MDKDLGFRPFIPAQEGPRNALLHLHKGPGRGESAIRDCFRVRSYYLFLGPMVMEVAYALQHDSREIP